MNIIHQRTVVFYADELIAVQVEDGSIFVPVGRMCDQLGLGRQRQTQRIREHPVMSAASEQLTITTGGGAQPTLCLRIDMIPLWLAGVNPNRVSESIREKLTRYQAEAAQVLWSAFKHDILPLSGMKSDAAVAIPTERSGAEIAYEIATAVQHLARQQMEMEQALVHVRDRVDRMAHWAQRVEQRLDTLEIEVSPAADISEEQAGELALAVKAVGQALTQCGEANGYQRVYGELYRRFAITSYKRLPRVRFTDVMEWLHAWHQELTDRKE